MEIYKKYLSSWAMMFNMQNIPINYLTFKKSYIIIRNKMHLRQRWANAIDSLLFKKAKQKLLAFAFTFKWKAKANASFKFWNVLKMNMKYLDVDAFFFNFDFITNITVLSTISQKLLSKKQSYMSISNLNKYQNKIFYNLLLS